MTEQLHHEFGLALAHSEKAREVIDALLALLKSADDSGSLLLEITVPTH